ncbi:hypothetical protein [Cyprinid herpesvirus 2]|nr:hypothetical protein [Cyprinid herpesvirus 2]QIM55263.1 hypothetical protein [Cyprinid herpesvirus 2]
MLHQVVILVCRKVGELFPDQDTKLILKSILSYHQPTEDLSSAQLEHQLATAFSSVQSLITRVDNEYTLFGMLLGRLGIPETVPKRLNPDGTENKKPFPVSTPLLWFLTCALEWYEKYEKANVPKGTTIKARKTVENMANAFAVADRVYNSTKVMPSNDQLTQAAQHLGHAIVSFNSCISLMYTLKNTAPQPLPSAYVNPYQGQTK